ncbi:MAG: putative NAD-dependent epimerase/dehydratase [Caballeronia sp.]|jgi:nucleoside-diphosphate-sugar epimerase|uniref:NAD-dependent epimerase/dehydratase family protein n=1 Tax=Caballeronia sp. TaxID=1931223 RepID=UPI002619E8F6|nr:NAD(P)-dependent oxidoreductase [Caballeronia sp.]MDB5832571.1 putative NAD-dependent epimerase/dehydratase [Caballeronia sp.]
MTVLITGGAGFVGLNIAEHLLGAGESVVLYGLEAPPAMALSVFDKLSSRLSVQVGDIRDGALLRETMRQHEVDAVVHGAAITASLAREATQASLIAAVNLGGTIELLEAALQQGVRRIVQLGTGSVFGASVKQGGLLDEETDVPQPDSLYGITKYAAERTAMRYRATRGLDVVVGRVGVAFGRWEYDTSVRDTLSIPLALAVLAESGGHAAFCDQIPNDWVYASDVADAVGRLLRTRSTLRPVYQIATGRRWSAPGWCERLRAAYPAFSYKIVKDVADANVGRQIPVPRPPFSIARLQADTDYKPRFDEARAFDNYLAWRRESASRFEPQRKS